MNQTKLYSKNKSGKTLIWEISSDLNLNSSNYIEIEIKFGQLDGKIQTKKRYVKSGKNIGKKNETTIQDQTLLEIKYLIQKQLDTGYVFDINDYQISLRPQLAHKYKDRKHTIDYLNDELYLSRKLNGIRCFYFSEVKKFESRTGKAFKFFSHFYEELKNIPYKNYIIDSEIFHPEIPFEVIASLVNNSEYTEVELEDGTIWSTDDLELHIYDIINLDDLNQNYIDRFINSSIYNSSFNKLKIVDQILVTSEKEIIDISTEWIRDGFEGSMIRQGNSQYDFGNRTNNLLKYKVMEQQEFKIKNIYLAENDTSKVMFTLYNHYTSEFPYNEFDCAIKGDKELAMKYFLNKDDYINHSYLTVDFQTLSSYSVPLFPVGIGVRQGTVIKGSFYPDV